MPRNFVLCNAWEAEGDPHRWKSHLVYNAVVGVRVSRFSRPWKSAEFDPVNDICAYPGKDRQEQMKNNRQDQSVCVADRSRQPAALLALSQNRREATLLVSSGGVKLAIKINCSLNAFIISCVVLQGVASRIKNLCTIENHVVVSISYRRWYAKSQC